MGLHGLVAHAIKEERQSLASVSFTFVNIFYFYFKGWEQVIKGMSVLTITISK